VGVGLDAGVVERGVAEVPLDGGEELRRSEDPLDGVADAGVGVGGIAVGCERHHLPGVLEAHRHPCRLHAFVWKRRVRKGEDKRVTGAHVPENGDLPLHLEALVDQVERAEVCLPDEHRPRGGLVSGRHADRHHDVRPRMGRSEDRHVATEETPLPVSEVMRAAIACHAPCRGREPGPRPASEHNRVRNVFERLRAADEHVRSQPVVPPPGILLGLEGEEESPVTNGRDCAIVTRVHRQHQHRRSLLPPDSVPYDPRKDKVHP
jgi:hypothetical protein